MARERTSWTSATVGGTPALDFANTITSPPPTAYGPIETYRDLLDWAEDAGVIDFKTRSELEDLAADEPGEAARVAQRAVGRREAIRAVFSALASGQTPPTHMVAIVIGAYAEAIARSSTTVAPGGAQVSWTGKDLSRPLHAIDYDAGRLLLSGDTRLVKECAGCPWLYLDRSRNHSRRWCDMQVCGSRSKMRRYRQSRQERADQGVRRPRAAESDSRAYPARR